MWFVNISRWIKCLIQGLSGVITVATVGNIIIVSCILFLLISVVLSSSFLVAFVLFLLFIWAIFC